MNNDNTSVREERSISSADVCKKATIILNSPGVRLTLLMASMFFASSIGVGIIIHYAVINLVDLLIVDVETMSDAAFYSILLGIIFLVAAPFWAGLKSITASVCTQESASLSGIFVAFSSIGRLLSSYFAALISILRYVLSIALVASPFYLSKIQLGGMRIDPDLLPLFVIVAALLIMPLGFVFFWASRKVTAISYFIWGEDMSLSQALGAIHRKIRIFKYATLSLSITFKNLHRIFLSVASLFVLHLLHTGPYMLICTNLLTAQMSHPDEEIL